MTTIFHVFCFQDHAETKAQLEKVKKDLAETKKESHKRKKLLMAQQQLIHAGSGSYNKVQQEQLWKKKSHRDCFCTTDFCNAIEYYHTLYQAHPFMYWL